jgi:hypothetical protein
MFQMKVAENIKAHILGPVNFFRKLCPSWEKVENSGEAREAADDNMVPARCILDQ